MKKESKNAESSGNVASGFHYPRCFPDLSLKIPHTMVKTNFYPRGLVQNWLEKNQALTQNFLELVKNIPIEIGATVNNI